MDAEQNFQDMRKLYGFTNDDKDCTTFLVESDIVEVKEKSSHNSMGTKKYLKDSISEASEGKMDVSESTIESNVSSFTDSLCEHFTNRAQSNSPKDKNRKHNKDFVDLYLASMFCPTGTQKLKMYNDGVTIAQFCSSYPKKKDFERQVADSREN